ncbi:MAG TPA: DEAD/DEAH box helicase [Candidatus Methylacidiphilales bacterium]|nr:DEAD/DEAH box helicase [Candidatus Methylacidiphilales bacterium]
MTSHSTTTPQPQPPAPAATITFAALALVEPLQRALRDKNYTVPSPIQAGAIPHLLQGRDLLGIAQTGTGKTAAFALPILQKLAAHPAPPAPKRPRALVLAPTRELAAQIGQSFQHYGRHLHLKHTVIFGGVGQHPQVQALARGVDIVVATPGRLKDLQQQKHVFLDKVEVFVLDEADRMLDMGFVHDVKRIITTLPPKRQSLLFSATMPPAVEEIAASLVHNPARVEVTPVATTAERIEQHVAYVDRGNKIKLLAHLIGQHPDGLVLAFVRMKHMANKLVDQLAKHEIRAEAIHGNKSQGARQRALDNFRTGRSRVLIATDIAARGIDVKGISLVVNYDLPEEPESYVHRIGRTARAGRDGIAVAFCDDSERNLLRQVERLIRRPIPVLKGHPYEASEPKPHHDRGPLGDGIDRPHRPSGPPRRSGGFRGRFRR